MERCVYHFPNLYSGIPIYGPWIETILKSQILTWAKRRTQTKTTADKASCGVVYCGAATMASSSSSSSEVTERRGIPGAQFVEDVQTYLTQLGLDVNSALAFLQERSFLPSTFKTSNWEDLLNFSAKFYWKCTFIHIFILLLKVLWYAWCLWHETIL